MRLFSPLLRRASTSEKDNGMYLGRREVFFLYIDLGMR
jgi:hypothetical protein